MQIKCTLEPLRKSRSEATASGSVSRSKPSAKAEWDKLWRVFITRRHTGEALKFRRQGRESCVPLFWAQGLLMPSNVSLFPCCATGHTALNGTIYNWKSHSSSCPWLSSMPNDILRDFEVTQLPRARLLPPVPTRSISPGSRRATGPASGYQVVVAGVRGLAQPHHSVLPQLPRPVLPGALCARRGWAHVEENPSKSPLHPGSRRHVHKRGRFT